MLLLQLLMMLQMLCMARVVVLLFIAAVDGERKLYW